MAVSETLLGPEAVATIQRRMSEVDALPPDYRALVHEYGWGVVSAFWRMKIPAKLTRHLIDTVLNGSHEIRERRWNTNVISHAAERMNKTLNEFRLPANGQAIVESLRRNGGILVPLQPTAAMVHASMDALPRRQPMEWVSKEKKHRLRLADALAAAEAEENGAAPHSEGSRP